MTETYSPDIVSDLCTPPNFLEAFMELAVKDFELKKDPQTDIVCKMRSNSDA